MSSLPETAPDFDQPLAVLKHCHNKIRKQLLTLEKLGAYLQRQSQDQETRQAAGAVLRYFSQAAPHHHADEEENLLPMLHDVARDADAQLLEQLAPGIKKDHREMEFIWSRLAQPLGRLAEGVDAALPESDIEDFSLLYARHMEIEEAHIAPMAQRLFTPAQMQQLGMAMRERRGIEHPEGGRDGAC